MSCLLTSGVTRNCTFAFGGLKKVYIANYGDISGVTYSANGAVSGITMVSGATFYEFEFEIDTASKLEELTVGATSRFVNQTLTFNLANLTQEKSNVLEELALAYVTAIIQTSDGLYWLFGAPDKSSGLRATALTVNSGAAKTDDSNVVVTLSGGSLGYSDEVPQSVVNTVI